MFPFFFVLYLSVVIFFIGISFNLFFLAGIDSEISTCEIVLEKRLSLGKVL